MRLSEWRTGAPNREALSGRVLEVVVPVLESLGAEEDPHCWVAWGDDPGIRYVILAPTAAGLVTCSVRLALPGEGPRASGKVIRWHRVQVGELAVESTGGHRLVAFQVETQVLRGADAAADRIAAFGLALLAAIDGRPLPDLGARGPRRKVAKKAAKGSGAARGSGSAKRTAAKPRAGGAGAGRRAVPRAAASGFPAPQASSPAIEAPIPPGSGSVSG
jgi:hypothetical protein